MAYNQSITNPSLSFLPYDTVPVLGDPIIPEVPFSGINIPGNWRGLDTRSQGYTNTPGNIRGGGRGLDTRSQGQLSDLFRNLNQVSAQYMISERTGGGRGGGAEVFQEDPMETNRFVSMNLNPYLTQNVSSFDHGGIYQKDSPADMLKLSKILPQLSGSRKQFDWLGSLFLNPQTRGKTIRMPHMDRGQFSNFAEGGKVKNPYQYQIAGIYDEGGTWGNTPIGFGDIASNETPYYANPYKYNTGGMYEQKANEMIAVNQLANLLGGMGANQQQQQQEQPMLAPLAPPMANKGIKMPKRYTEGGRF